ncbi:hypothetical protein LC55x_2776 [Lysobacter capsici]|nr:hypothetical protein LC55x_2776 [Lysobacter capsici]
MPPYRVQPVDAGLLPFRHRPIDARPRMFVHETIATDAI